MKKHLILTLLLLSQLQLPAADPFTFEAPRNWRSEQIPFPLGFAPELNYRGFEELRFGPGMFKPGSETYWTYAFFWWVEGKQSVSRAALEKDLVNYYLGLSRAVGRSKGLIIDPEKITAKLQSTSNGPTPKVIHDPTFKGLLTTYDAFATGKLLKLHVKVTEHYFKSVDRTWVWFSVSPKNPADKSSDSVWKVMAGMKHSFKLK